MKNLVAILLIFSLFLLLIPSIALFGNDKPTDKNSSVSDDSVSLLSSLPDSYKILDITTGGISVVARRDYLIGAVFAQMPAGFEVESIKAQAIIANTYAYRQHTKEKNSPTQDLLGADFSNDTNVYQAYFSPEQAKNIYGEEYVVYNTKISLAVDEVIEKMLIYQNEPIIPAFHSMCGGGITESAEVAWGTKVPYLIPASSVEDALTAGFVEEKIFTTGEIETLLTQKFSDISLGEDKSAWFKIHENSPSGTVLSVQVGNTTLTGKQLKDALSLRSGVFEVSYADSLFTFTIRGYGHGVGLSQYGANAMALQGKSYKEILLHYFKGVDIKDFSA